MERRPKMTPKERKEFFLANYDKITDKQMAAICEVGLPTIHNYEKEFDVKCLREPEVVREVEPKTLIQAERKARVLSESEKENKKKLKYLESENERLERELEASASILEYQPVHVIKKPRRRRKQSESVMVAVFSDLHVEKRVTKDKTSGVNEYNLDIARERVERYFQNLVKMLKKEQVDTPVNRLVLALLGDLVDGDIHEELLETSLLEPMYAVLYAYDLVSAGIDYILENTDVQITLPCVVGNHSRTTQKVHVSTETGHSVETLLYHHLASRYRDNDRVEFIIPNTIHLYLEVYGYTIRFMHGHHGLRYAGGVGGIAVPLGRIIPRWDSVRYADLTVMGHWHNVQDVGRAIINGSVIGYDPYALSIGAPAGNPEQVYFFINSKYGRSGYNKIFLF